MCDLVIQQHTKDVPLLRSRTKYVSCDRSGVFVPNHVLADGEPQERRVEFEEMETKASNTRVLIFHPVLR